MIQNPLSVHRSSQAVALATCCQTIYADDFFLVCIHYRYNRKRLSVEVRVRVIVAGILGKAQALEVSSVFSTDVKAAIRPAPNQ
jgi:hypothetical protein